MNALAMIGLDLCHLGAETERIEARGDDDQCLGTKLLERKPAKRAAVALANKITRIAWN